MLLSKEDIRAAGGIVHSDGNVFFTNLDQLNAAILAKLGAMKLPEPVRLSTTTNRDGDPYHITGYTAEHLHQTYAQGAAAQLSSGSVAETTCACYPDHGGTIYAEAVLPEGTKLYTRREAK